MKCLMFTTRSIRAIVGQNIVEQMHIIHKYCDKFDYLTTDKTENSKKILNSFNLYADKIITEFTLAYNDKYVNYKSWLDVYNDLDVSCLKNYDLLYLVGGLYLPQNGICFDGNKKGVFPEKFSVPFRSTGPKIINILALIKAHNIYNIPFHELSFDPHELYSCFYTTKIAPKINENYFVYHGYTHEKYNIYRLDTVPYYYRDFKSELIEKKYDLVFGYTYAKDNRENSIIEFENFAKDIENKLIFKKDFTDKNIDSYVDRKTYLKYISESKFTYMMPSYWSEYFSIYRFIESLAHDCLPIIGQSCNIEQVNKSFNVDLSILKYKELPDENTRIRILNKMKKIFVTPEKINGFKEI